MDNTTLSYVLALSATLCFSTASIAFAHFSKHVSVVWMNAFKAAAAFVALTITILLMGGWHAPGLLPFAGLMLSGLIGLNIGDLFLFKAYTRLGVARTLILFGFQPLLLGIGGYYFFGQDLDPRRFLAVIFLVGCLVTFSLERYRLEKRWELSGLFSALMGVTLDACGILLTRASFGANPELSPVEGNFYRCLGALIGFAALSQWRPIGLVEKFLNLPKRNRAVLIAASLGGTYLSLLLYLTAIKVGHLASIAGIAITGPMFAAGLESAIQRKAPSRYLIVAFAFFCAGFFILLSASAKS